MSKHNVDLMAGSISDRTMTAEQSLRRNPYLSEKFSIQEGFLRVVQGPHTGQQIPLNKPHYHIGREDWCDIVLSEDRWVSKHHCELRVTSSGIRVRDLNSRNGIFLQGVRVFEAIFQPGFSLQIGESVLELNVQETQKEIDSPCFDSSQRLVGKSPGMRRIFSMLERLAPLDLSVLLLGETGTGKSSVAQALHEQSPRREGPFVVVNCGAISANLMESAFFGHEKGAFTGADSLHRGYLEQANGGTLFLDEIGELSLELQPKLLDVLERKRIKRLGGESEIKVDFRLVSATHRVFPEHIKQGFFREDLFYRISVSELTVPPLRERPEDLPLLLEMFLMQLASDKNLFVSPAALQKLKGYLWPGNIRQLRNIIECAVAFAEGVTIHESDIELPASPDLSSDLELSAKPVERAALVQRRGESNADAPMSLKSIVEQAEREALEQALERTGWNITMAAESLDISRVWTYNRIKKYGLKDPSK